MRKKKTRKQKNDELRRRYDAIKDLMSTFAMSTVAVVAVVTLIPASPKAEIKKVVALSEEVVYQVNITDEENALDVSSLYVVLENQLEHYEQPVTLGENSGYFDNLSTNTDYRLSVYGNKGFGSERLDTTTITTKERIGGTILSVTPEGFDYNISYFVDVSIYDPDMKYSEITLYYGQSFHNEETIEYFSLDVTEARMEFQLTDLYSSNQFHIYIEGITVDGSEILDELWVTPPYHFYGSAYLEHINSEEASFHVYGDMDIGIIQFEMNVYRNDMLVKSKTVSSDPEMSEENGFTITGLRPETTYIFECIAIFTNPNTLSKEEKVIYTEEITTLSAYNYTYNIEEYDTYYDVTIVLEDPGDHFDRVNYEVYDTSEPYEMYILGYGYTLDVNGTEKTYAFTIDRPDISTYKIQITLTNSTNPLIFEIINTIQSK
jgi:hypothetical protein